jgi:DNA-binding IclR family transcriptional regulator
MPVPPSPAVLRACDVLDHLATNPEDAFSVSEVARSVGVPRASCDSVLLALAERGLVQRDDERRYSLGPVCRTLGEAARVAGAPLTALEPVADELARTTASCVAIASCVRGQSRVERVYDRGPAFGLRARVGESVPLAPPFGAVFVAWDGDAAIDGWLDRAGAALGPAERAHTVAALAAARERGYTVSVAGVHPDLRRMLEDLADAAPDPAHLDARDALIREISPREYLPVAVATDGPQRVNQMSAPVFDAAGKVPYALMVLGPSHELSRDEVATLGGRLLEAARTATERIGGRHP